MNSSHLEITNLHFSYKKNQPILKNISLRLSKSSVVGILGESGCGKSTFFRILSGLENANSGEMYLKGEAISKKQKVGLVMQDLSLFPHLTVLENIKFGVSSKHHHTTVENLLAHLELKPFLNFFPSELSGGQAQRVALARTLATLPELLLLDEAFSNLNQRLRTELFEYTIQFAKKHEISILFVSHDIHETFRYSDEILFFHDGAMVEKSDPYHIYYHPENISTAHFFHGKNHFYLTEEKSNHSLLAQALKNKGKEKGNSFFIPKHSIHLHQNENFFEVYSNVIQSVFVGGSYECKAETADGILTFFSEKKIDQKKVSLFLDLDQVLIF